MPCGIYIIMCKGVSFANIKFQRWCSTVLTTGISLKAPSKMTVMNVSSVKRDFEGDINLLLNNYSSKTSCSSSAIVAMVLCSCRVRFALKPVSSTP